MAVAENTRRGVRRPASGKAATPAGDQVAPKPRDPLATTTGGRIDAAALVFDPDWYRREYPDVASDGVDPVRHFLDNGAREGRNPNRFFDTRAYAAANADVAAAGMNPFMHFLLYGAREGREPSPRPGKPAQAS